MTSYGDSILAFFIFLPDYVNLLAYLLVFFYKKHVYKNHEAEMEYLRDDVTEICFYNFASLTLNSRNANQNSHYCEILTVSNKYLQRYRQFSTDLLAIKSLYFQLCSKRLELNPKYSSKYRRLYGKPPVIKWPYLIVSSSYYTAISQRSLFSSGLSAH